MSVPLPPGTGLENIDSDQIKTFKDFLISYNKLTEMCFTDCVTDFTTRNIKHAEDISTPLGRSADTLSVELCVDSIKSQLFSLYEVATLCAPDVDKPHLSTSKDFLSRAPAGFPYAAILGSNIP